MTEKNLTAPERFQELQASSIRSFTSKELQDTMGLTKAQADAVIVYGTSNDMLRITKRANSREEQFTVYELSNWRTKWITKPWGVANVSRSSDRMAPD